MRVLKPGGSLYISDPRFPLIVRWIFNTFFKDAGFRTTEKNRMDFERSGFKTVSITKDVYVQVVHFTKGKWNVLDYKKLNAIIYNWLSTVRYLSWRQLKRQASFPQVKRRYSAACWNWKHFNTLHIRMQPLLRWTEQIACRGRSEVLHDLSFGCSALFLSELIRFMWFDLDWMRESILMKEMSMFRHGTMRSFSKNYRETDADIRIKLI